MSQPIKYKSLVDISVVAELEASDTVLIEQDGHFKRMPASIITDLLSRFIVDDEGNVCLNGVKVPGDDIATTEISATEIAELFNAYRNAE